MSSLVPGPAILFCPANRPDRYSTAAERADGVILDLEDAVGPADKDTAREHAAAALGEIGKNLIVRVNARNTPWHDDDVAAVRAASGTVVMLPKAESSADLDRLDGLAVIAICETAAGVLHAEQIAAHPNCAALLWGGEDLTADLGGRRSRSLHGRYHGLALHARHTTLLAAGAAGKPAIDAVHIDIPDLDGLRRETAEAADMGFAAKACIHPSHIESIRAEFADTPEQVSWASDVLAAADDAAGDVFAFRGRMIDEPLLRHARRILERNNEEG